MARRDIEAGSAFVRLYVKSSLNRGLRAAQARLQAFAGHAQAVGGMLRGVGLGIGGIGAAVLGSLGVATKHFADFGDTLDKMSARTGVAASALAEFGFAAEQSGTDLATIEKAIRRQQKLVRDLDRGLSTATDAFDALGLSIDDVRGLSPEDQFELIASRLADVEDATLKAALAQEIFGRAGTALLPMIGSLKELRQEARDLGIVPAEDDVANAAKVTDAINRVRRVLGGMLFEIGAALADTVLQWLDTTKRIVTSIGRWIRENRELAKTVGMVAVALVGIGGVAMTAGGAFALLGFAASGAAFAVGALASVLGIVAGAIGTLLSPVGLVVAALAGIGIAVGIQSGAFRAFGETASQIFGTLKTVATETMQGVSDAIRAGDLALAGRIAFTGLQLAALEAMTAMGDAIGGKWGDVLKGISAKITGGDFKGAWNDTLLAMTAAFSTFASNLSEILGPALTAGIDTWKESVASIAKTLLQIKQTIGEVTEALAPLTRALELIQQFEARDVTSMSPGKDPKEQAFAGFLQGVPGARGGNWVARQLFGQDLGDLRGKLKVPSLPGSSRQSFLGSLVTGQAGPIVGNPFTPNEETQAAQADVDRQLDLAAEKAKDYVAALQESIDNWATSTNAELDATAAEGAELAESRIDELRNRLQELRDEAARAADEARKEAERKKAEIAVDVGEAADVAAGKSLVSFSAAALSAAGGGSPAKQIVDSVHSLRRAAIEADRAARKEAAAQAKRDEDMIDALGRLGFEVG